MAIQKANTVLTAVQRVLNGNINPKQQAKTRSQGRVFACVKGYT